MDNEIKKLTPFKLWVLQNFPFIEEDFDALTNYEMMCKIVAKLNEVVDLTNEQTTIINQLSESFQELYDFIHQYIFDYNEIKEAIVSVVLTVIVLRVEPLLFLTKHVELLVKPSSANVVSLVMVVKVFCQDKIGLPSITVQPLASVNV